MTIDERIAERQRQAEARAEARAQRLARQGAAHADSLRKKAFMLHVRGIRACDVRDADAAIVASVQARIRLRWLSRHVIAIELIHFHLNAIAPWNRRTHNNCCDRVNNARLHHFESLT